MAPNLRRATSAHSLYCQDEEEHKSSESIKSYEMLDVATRRTHGDRLNVHSDTFIRFKEKRAEEEQKRKQDL